MLDLRQLFFDRVKEGDYYHHFYSLVEDVNKTWNVFDGEQITEEYEFLVCDEEEAIGLGGAGK